MSTDVNTAKHAGFWIRFAAYIVDYCVVYVGVLVVLAAIGADTGESNLWIVAAAHSMFAIDALVIWLIYDVSFQISPWQATPGKRLLGLQLTDNNYRRLTVLRAVARYATSYASGLLLGIGYVMIAFTGKKQALHDLIAGTYVIYRYPTVTLLPNSGNVAETSV